MGIACKNGGIENIHNGMQVFTRTRLAFLVCVGILLFLIILPDRILPASLRPIKDRTTMMWDYVTDSREITGMLAVIFGKADYTPVGAQIGDGELPSSAVLNDPTGVVGDNRGTLYVSERRHFRIRKISNGVISTMAGTGRRGFSGEGFSGLLARVNRPEGIDRDQAGNLFFADSFNHRVRKISTDGKITTVAGTGVPGYSGDGGFAVEAEIAGPMDVKIGPSGSLFIIERDNHCVRRVSPNGNISTIAGTGKPGFSGDGGLGSLAMLNTPYGIAVDHVGNLYVADSENHRVRKISTEGVISTVAGTGSPGFSGDGRVATQAELNNPQSVLLTSEDDLLIGDEHNNRIRKVSPKGIITTIAGTGEPGFSGDGGPAIHARLNDPEYLWRDSEGNVFIADGDNGRIRIMDKQGIINTVAGGGRLKP